MPITLTIQADNFQELFTMLRDVPVGAVVAPGHTDLMVSPESIDQSVAENPPPISTTTAEVDADGVEWNAELHASSKAKTKDGKWRKKRGVDSEETPDPAPAAPVTMPHTAAPPSNAPTYADIVTMCSQKMQTGALTGAILGTLQMEFGIENMTMLIGKPEMIPAFYARIQAL